MINEIINKIRKEMHDLPKTPENRKRLLELDAEWKSYYAMFCETVHEEMNK